MFESFFQPESIAVVGANRTPGKVGHDVVKNLLEAGYPGPIFPINPKADEILGLRCYGAVTDVEQGVDLAVIVVPAKIIPSIVDECAEKGIKAVIIISAGFKESGPDGAALEQDVAERCRRRGIRCIGPNCLGLVSPHERVNASFGPAMPAPGNIAFFSQSGALGTAMLDIAAGEGIGLSRFISFGNKMDINESDLIEALGQDEKTDVILGYIESIEDGSRFMEVAGRITRAKPVIILKSGRTSAGAQAASSHTGSLAGADSAYDAAFRQSGVIRAESIGQLFSYARAFAAQQPPAGPRVAVVTNAGGPGILATDAIESSDLQMAEFQDATARKLADALPAQAALHNPVDVLGDAQADRYKAALDAICADPGVDAMLTLLTPQASTRAEEYGRAVTGAAARTDKPLLACFMGSASVRSAWQVLKEGGVPNFEGPAPAVAALDALHTFGLRRRTEPEAPPSHDFDDAAIRLALEQAREKGRSSLGERQARAIARACGIPLPRSIFAGSEEDAVRAAKEIGYPVVMKISSEDILHKSDAGGVLLDRKDETEARAAYRDLLASARRYKPDADLEGVLVQATAPRGREVIIGMKRDPQFGPLIMFGLGGVYVEVLKDVVFRVAPIALRDARQMVEGIRSAAILHAFRGQPEADLEALADCLTRVSQLAVEHPEIHECDLNPLFVYPQGKGLMAVDIRFGLKWEQQ